MVYVAQNFTLPEFNVLTDINENLVLMAPNIRTFHNCTGYEALTAQRRNAS